MRKLLTKAAAITNEIVDKVEISTKDGKYSIREKNTGLFVGFDSKDNIVKNIFEKL
jgi:hypothetical protein